ncbi:hypothetical protein P8935_04150 [Telmatobacter sp. DSM 110680]|uniref:ABC-type transport system involved in multi-copper enzyme maturation, permease component n=1 Tax=Telmatobacter sp. DSM 110680 TaxID=3036704 RepID=A0AAU7DMI7_9BACT
MKQILHIFVKDARHQWLEILISLVVTAALVFTCPSRWHAGAMMYGSAVSFSAFGLVSDLPNLLVFLVPLSWWLLISPLIHDEKLVGDRQFWVTRPYEWKKLLAAKVLFLIVFLYTPLLLAQCLMLAEAGFSPFSSFRGILYDSLLITCVLALPLVALATVTRNFARMTLAVLGGIVCLIAIVLLLATYHSPDRTALPHQGEITVFIAFFVCLAVIIVQYWRRSARVSWVLLALLVVLFGAFSMGGAPDNAQMDRDYPGNQQKVVAAQFAYQEKEGTAASALVAQRDRVGISIPVLVSGVPDGTVTIPDFLKVTLQSSGGTRWTSAWQSISMNKFFPGERVASAQFTMPRVVYDELIGKPLSVQITFALSQARAEKVERFNLGQDDFAASGLRICTAIRGFAEPPDEIGGIACRAPLEPELTLVNSAWSSAPCSGTSPKTDDSVQSAAWIGSLEKASMEFGIVPVWSSAVNLSNQFVTGSDGPTKVRHLCAGTPVTFTKYTLMARTQTTLGMNGFQLPRLNAGQLRVITSE